MDTLRTILVSMNVIVALLTVLLILTCQTGDGGLVSNASSRFAPGAVDSTKDKVITILIAIFVFNILIMDFIGYRIQKRDSASTIDKVDHDVGNFKSIETED